MIFIFQIRMQGFCFASRLWRNPQRSLFRYRIVRLRNKVSGWTNVGRTEGRRFVSVFYQRWKYVLRLSVLILNVVTIYCRQSVVVGCGPDNPTIHRLPPENYNVLLLGVIILPYMGPVSSFLEGHVNWARVWQLTSVECWGHEWVDLCLPPACENSLLCVRFTSLQTKYKLV